MVKIGKYDYTKSTVSGKKLRVVVDGKIINFGDSSYQHFNDKTKLLDLSLNHNDEKRRQSYLKRAKGIKDKDGKLTHLDPLSPNYHAIKILW